MVYHSQLDITGCDFACGFPLVPVRSRSTNGLPTAASGVSRDIVDETLYAFRANIFLRNFEVKGPADKLLIYLTLYVSLCLKRIADMRLNKVAAETLLFQLAHEPFKLPGDSGFTLGGLLSPPADKQEEGVTRSYLRQCREEAGHRLVHKCFDKDDLPSKYWLAFAQKKFLNKTLT